MDYPHTRTTPQRDDYHGTPIDDPYRWLEQSADTPEVGAWIAAQNLLSDRYLGAIPQRQALEARLTELWHRPSAQAPLKRGQRYFQFRNDGGQNQAALYLLAHPTDPGHLLIDPNLFSPDGTVALVAIDPSPSGRYLAYAVSEGGSDWRSWRIRDVASGEDLPDRLERSKFSVATWLPDDDGFYYLRYPEPRPGKALLEESRIPSLMYHRLGTDQASDRLIYTRPDDPSLLFAPAVSHDGSYLLLSLRRGSSSGVSVLVGRPAGDAFVTLVDDFDANYTFLGLAGDLLLLRTDAGAPNGRVVAARPTEKGATWTTVVAESENLLEDAWPVDDELLLLYQRHAQHHLVRQNLDTGDRSVIALPPYSSLVDQTGSSLIKAERYDDEAFFSISGFLQPSTPYRLDLKDGALTPLTATANGPETDSYQTRQLFVTSKDGTAVPLFLVHRKGLELDGSHPTLLYGYGGFNASQMPSFEPGRQAWLELGGVLAIANLRGGGEYGRSWHDAGRLGNKQNVFDDFIACAEHLIAAGITNSAKLAIQGHSNGGLLVGACLTQRPELFAAALPMVGVMDMLRFHHFTIGWAWVSDYGSADDPDQFPWLVAYSPLHNVRPSTAYPATLVTTSDHDDRVVPAHSFKFAAALQAAQIADAPILLKVETRAGHGSGKPTTMKIDEDLDIYAFLCTVLEVRA